VAIGVSLLFGRPLRLVKKTATKIVETRRCGGAAGRVAAYLVALAARR
jgi:hypothetical protein